MSVPKLSALIRESIIKVLCLLFIVGGVLPSFAQVLSPAHLSNSLTALSRSKNDTNKVKLLLEIAEHYINKPGEENRDLDSAQAFLENAMAISKNLKYEKGIGYTYLLLAKNYRERGQKETGDDYLSKSISYSAAHKDYYTNGMANVELSYHYTYTIPDQYEKKIDAWEKAHISFTLAGAKSKMAYCLENLADLHQVTGDYLSAIKELKQALINYKEAKEPLLQGTYDLLSRCYYSLNDFESALRYGLEAVKIVERFPYASEQMHTIYSHVAAIYMFLEYYEQAKEYDLRAVDVAKKLKRNQRLYRSVFSYVRLLTRADSVDKGLKYLKQMETEYPVPDTELDARRYINNAYLGIYTEMKRWPDAEMYYQKQKALARKIPIVNADYDLMLEYLTKTGKVQEGDSCLNSYIAFAKRYNIDTLLAGNIHYYSYKLDSCRSEYISSLRHLKQFHNYYAENYENSRKRLIQALQIEFETEKKEQQIKLQAQELNLKEKNLLLNRQNLMLVTKQSELQKKDFEQSQAKFLYEAEVKEKSLQLAGAEAEKKTKDLLLQKKSNELLKQESLANQSSFKKANSIKNLTLAGVFLSLVIIALLLNQYRVKKKANAEISKKNALLEKLVEEKEWLVREIHHRVKNNLQTIVSLLESQTIYLNNPDALLAIKDSQNRVFTMSLLHQKLYQTENLDAINMNVYISELLSYLKDTFDTRQTIQFCTEIQPILLDVSQAIPIGLIINEAVTNSIKHAFPVSNNNTITIEMKQDAGGQTYLTIVDNGIGFDDLASEKRQQSLGLKLIHGLSEDIRADLKIESDTGTKIYLEFMATKLASVGNSKISSGGVYA